MSLQCVYFYIMSVISHPMIYCLKNQQYYLHEIWLRHIPSLKERIFLQFLFLQHTAYTKKHRSFFLPILEMLKLINTSHISAILISTPFPCPWISGRTVQTKIQQSLTHTLWTSGFLYKNQINLTWLSLGLQHSSPWIRY